MISMKMSAAWEAEKSSSGSIRRLCHIQIGQIILDRPVDLGENSSGVHVAVRMRGSTRRILRSPEIGLIVPKPVSGGNATSRCSILIDLNCTIKYSHVLKIDSNILQILLQKRKKYKNTTMNLGYKTLAYCNINLSHVLQRRIQHRFLDMYPDPKCTGAPIARIEVHDISTVPWERDLISGSNKGEFESDGGLDDSCLLPTFVFSDEESDTDDDDDLEDGGDEVLVGDRPDHQMAPVTSTSAAVVDNGPGQKKVRKSMSVGQIKQKVISLLKRLRLADPNEYIDTSTTFHLWDEFDKMGGVSDVDEDLDFDAECTMGSFQPAPRPSIRPFFGRTASSEESLSLDAGARLLRRMQKEEAVSATDPAVSNPLLTNANTILPDFITPPDPTEPHRQYGSRADHGGTRCPPPFGSSVRQTKDCQLFPSCETVARASPAVNGCRGHHGPVQNLAPANICSFGNCHSDCVSTAEAVDACQCVEAEMFTLPDCLADVQFVVNSIEPGGKIAAAALKQAGCNKLALISSFGEVKQVMSGLVSWAQLHLEGSRLIRVCVVGGDSLVSSVLRAYVELVGSRSEPVAAAFRFFLVPVSGLVGHEFRQRRRSSSTTPTSLEQHVESVRPTYPGSPSTKRDSSHPAQPLPCLSNVISRRLCDLDAYYARLFGVLATSSCAAVVLDPSTHFAPTEAAGPSSPTSFVGRLIHYLTRGDCLLQLPIGECLVAGSKNPATSSSTGFASHQPHSSGSPPDFNPPLPLGSCNNDGGGIFEEADSSGQQILVPFLLCIGLGIDAVLPSCLYPAQALGVPPTVSTTVTDVPGGGRDSAPVPPPHPLSPASHHHPPGAPHLHPRMSFGANFDRPTFELQMDYWTLNAGLQPSSAISVGVSVGASLSVGQEERGGGLMGGVGRASVRPITCKATCRSILIALGSHCGSLTAAPTHPKPSGLLSVAMLNREKKPKIMRIGKKTGKEVSFKPELVEGVTRLICTCKGVVPPQAALPDSEATTSSRAEGVGGVDGASSRTDVPLSRGVLHRDDLSCGLGIPPLPSATSAGPVSASSGDQCFVRVSIDGVDWHTSRFFQVSPGWRTHVKVFPLVCMSLPPTSAPQLFALPLTRAILTAGQDRPHVTAAVVPSHCAALPVPLESSSPIL